MDVPAPEAGTVAQLRVQIGDRVSEGSVLLTLEPDGAGSSDGARRRRRAERPRRGSSASPPLPRPRPPTAPAAITTPRSS